ncbi:MAG: bifunctional metallophosphatase/5'-nucleotidase [Chloroflexi bacterium HGW-Chloroflexi-3]|nr:MAG: bifunctional metallophosphatase/5'-nucleotidase [Chloroflexi bacterium HGW-Chloroflexi-3]
MTKKNIIYTEKGRLRLHKGYPNPKNASDRELYLFTGDPTAGLIEEIIPDEGVLFPESLPGLKNNDFFLTLYHFNDVHGHLVRFTPEGDEPVFTRMANQINEKRTKVENDPYRAVLTLSAGDDCIGTVFDELMDDTFESNPVHASYRLYSEARVDLSVLGNHDFDMGLDVLKQSIQNDAKFPILAANLTDCSFLEGLYYPAALMVVKGIRIGIIGLATSAEYKISKKLSRIYNPVQTALNILPALRPLCDVVILLTHLGYSLAATSAITAEAGDVELAKSLPYAGVHLIVGGHSHHELNHQGLNPHNIVNGIPIVQAGSLGRYLGRVDLRIRQKSAAVAHVRLIPTETIPVDHLLEQKVMKPLIHRARSYFARVLGNVGDDAKLSTDYVRATFASGELALANFITDGMAKQLRKAGQSVDMAMIDSSCVRRGLNVGGQLTFGDWFNVMPFADTIRFYQLTGWQLRDLIHDNAKRIDLPGEPNTERGFLQFSNEVRYTVRLGKTRAEIQIQAIQVNGIALEEQLEKEFLMATTSFVRELAGNWENCHDQSLGCDLLNIHDFNHFESDYFMRRELVKCIIDQGGITQETGARLDGRLRVEERMTNQITDLSVKEFNHEISFQNHAMAGAVISYAAVSAVSLGFACIRNTQRFLDENSTVYQARLDQLASVQEQLLDICDKDANAIGLLVSLRNAGEEMQGQRLLCEFPARISQLSIMAAQTLQDFRSLVNERVKDDLEMSINLLTGTAQSALLLLDSNLRIWTDPQLADQFEPILDGLIIDIEHLSPVKRIRS